MDEYIQISIRTPGIGLSEILIAELSEIGFEGFEENDIGLDAFIHEDQFSESALVQIMQKYALGFEKKQIPKQNWNEQWEQNYEPIIINSFCAIRSGFHHPIHQTKYEIIITPKMSFGTGHHATTYMMIAAMETLSLSQKKIVDYGTGTGILAILAEKMGADEITAIDYDEWSIENAKENLMVNHCQRIKLVKSDHLPLKSRFDLILANINKSVIFSSLLEIEQQLNKDGVLLLSGILKEDLSELRLKVEKCRMHISEINERNNWICVRLTKEG